jgi:hypothetical protein
MASGPEKMTDLPSFVPVEKSLSIDAHHERDKQQESRRKRRQAGSARTVQQGLEEQECLKSQIPDDENHVDYRA